MLIREVLFIARSYRCVFLPQLQCCYYLLPVVGAQTKVIAIIPILNGSVVNLCLLVIMLIAVLIPVLILIIKTLWAPIKMKIIGCVLGAMKPIFGITNYLILILL